MQNDYYSYVYETAIDNSLHNSQKRTVVLCLQYYSPNANTKHKSLMALEGAE
jgi:hypothetical protein